MICQIDANCSQFQLLGCASLSHQARTLKLIYYGLVSNFSKYYYKTGTICLLSYLHASEFDSNHFGILLWKIEKLRDQNEIKQPIEKTFRIRHILWCPEINCRAHLQTKFTIIVTRYPTSKRNKKCFNFDTTFQKKVNFSR